MKDTEKTFIITDLCMWEKNKQEGTFAPHCIGVVDEETGETRFINSGAKIRFLSGEISPKLIQKNYNKLK